MSISVNPSDKDSLLTFFAQFKHLSNIELGLLINRSASTIRRWKRVCGLSEGKKVLYPRLSTSKKQITEEVPVDWDSKEWFYDQYINKKHGILKIAQILGRSRTLVQSRLDRYGIETRSQKESTSSSSKYKSFNWLNKRYVDDKWSIEQCAAEAYVVNETIKEWMIEFGIEPRTVSEALTGRKYPKRPKVHKVHTTTKEERIAALSPEFRANIEKAKERAKYRREKRTTDPQTDLLIKLGEDLEGL